MSNKHNNVATDPYLEMHKRGNRLKIKDKDKFKNIKEIDANTAALLNAGKLYGFMNNAIIIAYMSDILCEKAIRNSSIVENAIEKILGISVAVRFIITDRKEKNLGL